ncbi:MAG TPA: tRNA 2-thiouridine(34) synthase MnmA [Syntrophales bacterium]|nr:tRNA 2-thiouridine(34) synthase MnmA [Syntrophales bacterium]HRT70431.1 tRNA 2-thiouridine(34) synthase MnmA [Syntrophales bacterium]
MTEEKRHTADRKVLVAMSGGVDSTVAAFLLKEQGYDIAGVTMNLRLKGVGDESARCCGPDVLEDARRVCERLGVAHHVVDYARELEERVVSRFVREYRRGRTPNPCVDCNRHLKFGSLLGKAVAMGFDFLATGHYARIDRAGGGCLLRRPRDRRKDQTYFLYSIPRDALRRIIFPLAPFTKEEVRRIAARAGLPLAEKKESQDICFVTQKNYGAFISQRIDGIRPGPITDLAGKKVGEHRGIVFYTVGQRSGLRVSAGRPLYVVSIDPAGNRIVVGEKEDVLARGLIAGDINALVEEWPAVAYGKLRYRKKEEPCRVSVEGRKLRVMFEEKQEAITPGQSVVLYDGDVVLGGGVIEEVIGGVR